MAIIEADNKELVRFYGPRGTFMGHIELSRDVLHRMRNRDNWQQFAMMDRLPVMLPESYMNAPVAMPSVEYLMLAYDTANEEGRPGVRLLSGTLEMLDRLPQVKFLPSASYIRSLIDHG